MLVIETNLKKDICHKNYATIHYQATMGPNRMLRRATTFTTSQYYLYKIYSIESSVGYFKDPNKTQTLPLTVQLS